MILPIRLGGNELYIINCVEIKTVRGDKVPCSEPVELEYYNDVVNAGANLSYLSSIFGKHYSFYITKRAEE